MIQEQHLGIKQLNQIMTQETLSAKIVNIEKIAIKLRAITLITLITFVGGVVAWWVKHENREDNYKSTLQAQLKADKTEILNLINNKFQSINAAREIDSAKNESNFQILQLQIDLIRKPYKPHYGNYNQRRNKKTGEITYIIAP